MNRVIDIFFLLALGIILVYFLLSIIQPNFIKGNVNKYGRRILLIPIILIIMSSLGYFIINLNITKNKIPNKYIEIKTDLDSLDKLIESDTIVVERVDSLINELGRKSQELKDLESKQIELQKRLYIRQFNKSVSDSILFQIEERLNKISAKQNFNIQTKILTSGNKVLTYNGKVLVSNQKVFKDIYTIDSFNVYPKIKNIDFTKTSKISSLNYYIDSVEIHFRVIKNKGKAVHIDPDSILYVSINPIKAGYGNYQNYTDIDGNYINYLDKIKFRENRLYKLVLDYPNISENDTIICFDFLLQRGMIDSYCVSFNDNK